VKLGVFTVVYGDLPLAEALDRVVALELDAVEIGTGNYPGDAHNVPELQHEVAARGLEISALSCHGNPLHPDEAFARRSHDTWARTVELANELGVATVVCFSGCPGDGPTGTKPNWVTCAWPPDYLEVLEWQWAERAIPYWTEAAATARAAGVRIAIEPHPGFLVYNPETALRLRGECGDEIGVNLDPSHFVWQGIDPLLAIRELGDAIFHVHAKDVYVDPHNRARNGVLDTKRYDRFAERSWSFRSVGYGQGEQFWRDFVSALRIAGYDGVLSIEHEDGLASVQEGLTKAVEVLQSAVLREPPSAMWWA
jgi:sugar phosphate isomerase/epimerase